ncbi:MAG: HpcH/HpaI aldolase/citrate lyase family protein, partial [Bacteroidales bacterium]|nr:HpcH/HpaI aldolase/citrate lyase family protein [Bacteroidales bacterium]
SGGIQIELKSKVSALYGEDILSLMKDIFAFCQVKNARLFIEDSGALPYVLSARLEAALEKILNTGREYLLPMLPENNYSSEKERFRFSRLYLPGNNPAMMINAGLHKPHGIILDLEDSVAFDKKHEARFLVRNALRQLNFYGVERMVRINQIPAGIEDLRFVIPHNVHLILVPKCESAMQVEEVEKEISRIKKESGIKRDVFLMPIIESALGIENAFTIARASRNIVGLAIGLEDYTADLGVQRTNDGMESLYARMRLVNACKAAGIQAIDSVFSDVGDMDALLSSARISKSMGFEGMGCIHPRQVEYIHKAFAPGEEETEKAQKIVDAFITASEKGLGVVSLGTKMIDAPVVKRAQKTIELAVKLGILSKDWRNGYGAK